MRRLNIRICICIFKAWSLVIKSIHIFGSLTYILVFAYLIPLVRELMLNRIILISI